MKNSLLSKRAFDLLIALLLLGLCSPLIALVAVAIKVSTPGPVLFLQKRRGYKRRVFVIYKFRTMYLGSGKPLDVVLCKDPRITFVGCLLRCTHLDELPQLWNVICGDMSLVGPRPLPVMLANKYSRTIPQYSERFNIMPGMTGLVQIHWRTETKKRGPEKAFRLERFYGKRQSLGLDLAILWQTLSVMIHCKGV